MTPSAGPLDVVGRLPDGRFQVTAGGRDFALPPSQAAQVAGMSLPDFEAKMAQATQSSLAGPRAADGSASSRPPIWQGRARYGHQAQVLSRNPDGTFQVTVDGAERTMTEPNVAFMTGLKKGPLYEMLGKATDGWMKPSDQPLDLQEARWSPKVLPKGVSPQAVNNWRKHLESKRVINPVLASELVQWQDHSVPEGKSLAGEKVIERSVQSMLDLIPREVIERLGKLNIATVQNIPGGVIAQYNLNTNTIEINHEEYSMWKRIETDQVQKSIVTESTLTPYIRETMWHEMGHWLHAHASSHPRLWRWRRNLEQHWRERTDGERVLTHKDGWKFIRDHWIKSYVGRWYPSLGWGFELPTVYLEEMSHGPERIAQWCQEPHHALTFKLVASLFGPL